MAAAYRKIAERFLNSRLAIAPDKAMRGNIHPLFMGNITKQTKSVVFSDTTLFSGFLFDFDALY